MVMDDKCIKRIKKIIKRLEGETRRIGKKLRKFENEDNYGDHYVGLIDGIEYAIDEIREEFDIK